jgi:hypothetical protein
MSTVLSYDEFLNEGLHVVKRKYTENHPEKVVSDYAPVRERVLSFLKEKGTATHEELSEFFKLLNEETGRKTTMGWIKANPSLVNVRESGGKKIYSLSKEGKRIHEKLTSTK